MRNAERIEECLQACADWGLIPTSFRQCMTWEEQVLWLAKFLQETVIPTVNQNTQSFNELKEFVDDYFDNLNVQEEINNKLDEMVQDGTIKSLINTEIFGELNNKVLQNTVDISANTTAIEGKISEGEASSITMSMLTQDVREALTGGSTAVVAEDSVDTENIVDGAVTLYKLDNLLQGTKYINYSEALALGEKSSGIIIENGTTHKAFVSGAGSTSFGWYKVALTKGKFYAVTSYNNYSAAGCIVVDSEENVVYNSIIDTSVGATAMKAIFRANETGMSCYLNIANSLPGNSIFNYNAQLIREMSSLKNVVEPISTETLIRTVTGTYPSITSSYSVPQIATYANCSTHIYAMRKGVKYNVKSYNWSQVVGLYILKLDNTIIYQSSDASVGDNFIPVDYTFTAQEDGFIVVPTILSRVPTVTVLQPFATTNGDGSGESITFEKWFALGDSLTEINFRASKNYVDYITEELGITTTNLGHSGAGYMKANQSSQTIRSEIAEISDYNYNTDVITVMGSINDFEYVDTALGQLGDTGTDTIYGCMYNFFSGLQSEYMGTRLGVITPPVTGTSYSTNLAKFTAYNQALKDTAKLFGVPVLDLTYSCNLKPWESNFRNEFYSADGTGGSGQVDSVHPNSKGHWLIHSKIKEFLKTL